MVRTAPGVSVGQARRLEPKSAMRTSPTRLRETNVCAVRSGRLSPITAWLRTSLGPRLALRRQTQTDDLVVCAS